MMPAALVWLALGAFAVGTEGMMIAGILPAIAGDLHVDLPQAGALVTVFALAYAIGSPVLSTLCGNLNRRQLLVGAMAGFAVANVLAALAPDYWSLAAARVLLALTAGLFMPNAYATAASLVGPERRGRAVAVVVTGMTTATALGVPVGAWIGAHADWRATFQIVAGVAALATIGLRLGLPAALPHGATTLRERLAVARQPGVLTALLVTFFWISGVFVIYTFIAPYLARSAGIGPDGVSAMLLVLGVGAMIGSTTSGHLTDRIGPIAVQFGSLTLLAATLAALSAATTLPQATALYVVVPLFAIWTMAGWSFNPAQTARLIRLAPQVSTIAVSLNASATYAGIAFGSAVGGVVMDWGDATDLGWVGGLSVLTALLILAATVRRKTAAAPQPAA